MPSLAFSGSVFAVPGTLRTIGTITNNGTYQWEIDLGSMADGDETELRVNKVSGPGGTLSLMFDGGYADRQSRQLKTSEPFTVTRSAQLSVKSTAGVARWYPFDVIII